jgi:ferredoxin--NADP+ reductase
MLAIDPEVCIDCGLCVDECPVQAIYPKEDLPTVWSGFADLNAAIALSSPKADAKHTLG